MIIRSHTICILLACVLPSLALAQTGDATSAAGIRCETFCSSSSLRTAGARLSWIDPSLSPSGTAAFDSSGVPSGAPPQLDVTVVRNGFDTDAYATLPTSDPIGASPTAAFATPPASVPSARAYALRVVGVVRPAIAGAFNLDEVVPNAERRETSIIIENLEPGLRYSWRLRFATPSGERTGGVAVCIAPVCPADVVE